MKKHIVRFGVGLIGATIALIVVIVVVGAIVLTGYAIKSNLEFLATFFSYLLVMAILALGIYGFSITMIEDENFFMRRFVWYKRLIDRIGQVS